MSLDEIKRNIDEQAKKEADGLHAAAAKEKESIMGEAAAKIRELNQKTSREIGEELKALSDDTDSNIELAVKDMALSAREEALAAEIPKIRRLLVKYLRASSSYGKLFKAAVKQARGLLPAGELIIAVNRSDKDRVAGLEAKIEIKDIGGGLFIRSKEGDIMIDATLDSVIDSRVEEIRKAILDELFGPRKVNASAAPKAKSGAKAKKRK